MHDAEIAAPGLRAEGLARALRPAQREPHGALGILVGVRIHQAFVELHLDIGAEKPLDFHRALGRQLIFAPVDMRLEDRTLLGDPAQLGQRHDLEAAGVGEDRIGPVGETMQAAKLGDRFRTGPQHEMIDIAEDDVGAGRAHLIRIKPFDGACRADRHEGGGTDLVRARS